MPEANQQGSQTVATATAKQPAQPAPNPQTNLDGRNRRDTFFLAIATAVLTRQNGRSPVALARECREFTDAFIAALDTPQGA